MWSFLSVPTYESDAIFFFFKKKDYYLYILNVGTDIEQSCTLENHPKTKRYRNVIKSYVVCVR